MGRYLIQRCGDGRTWWTRHGDDELAEATARCERLANNAARGACFRVVDKQTGEIMFEVINP